MNINDELINKLQRLASLEIDSNKLDSTKQNLSEIVNFVENINTLNLDNIEASFNAIKSELQMREDIPYNAEVRDLILKEAPSSENGFFIVPKIIE
ncbi:Asp-tRNA(Asn)/Glu-tRNA(Gln) amidotransferase subunit GatC [Helicobacter sp. WB40]|uniref:Asp-tRNA(Asn)/Glu-tRNA(Gln) amidotransferase subunit GatC n=1 Tax=Helicobacter sp. WB40 TaxID=3004130 RepID=UPI0022EC146F|nr:Asp-tRNA(Asn)/Glu-tRNA(Gln) amidotransferase subunit GatC [Helicobacter sp. WB40]MDA3967348.1 Asp-tRNA(Asn)/Glu-tRNA(Gln) amidotransferase subunit GatC [Helicobacter sp. WB40]